MRVRVSKFERVVRTHRFHVDTLLSHLCQIMNSILHTCAFIIYVVIIKTIIISKDKADIYEKIVYLNSKLK